MIVLDANILIPAVLGRRVRQLIDMYASQGVRFFAPNVAFDDAEKYLPPLLKKRGVGPTIFPARLDTYETSSSRSLQSFMQLLKVKPDPGCVVAMRTIGLCWPQPSVSHVACGQKMRISSELESPVVRKNSILRLSKQCNIVTLHP